LMDFLGNPRKTRVDPIRTLLMENESQTITLYRSLNTSKALQNN
jgi:hypothetical protein